MAPYQAVEMMKVKADCQEGGADDTRCEDSTIMLTWFLGRSYSFKFIPLSEEAGPGRVPFEKRRSDKENLVSDDAGTDEDDCQRTARRKVQSGESRVGD